MIDTHCHLTDERLHPQLAEVLARAQLAGVNRFITIGTDLEDSAACAELCQQNQNIFCAVGMHPGSVHEKPFAIVELEKLLHRRGVVAIGEIGLDYHWYKEIGQQKAQKRVFIEQMQLAKDEKLPVVIHCREAVVDCLAIMRDFAEVRAVFHCFTGTMDEARAILDAGYWLGFTGAVTFKKNEELRDVATMAPAERILVETDAPYLTPEPMRKQKTNEPAMVVHVAKVIAQARGISVEELDLITTQNAERLFKLR